MEPMNCPSCGMPLTLVEVVQETMTRWEAGYYPGEGYRFERKIGAETAPKVIGVQCPYCHFWPIGNAVMRSMRLLDTDGELIFEVDVPTTGA